MSGGERLHVEVLGPIRVRSVTGADRTPDGALQRRLLALLVLHRGREVSAEAAIEALWPGGPPRDPRPALQTHLSRLRKALPDLIDSTDSGYRLDAGRIELDADGLAAAVTAEATDPGAASAVAAALERWRGPAYPELADDDDGRAEAARLEELRVLAREREGEARLAGGTTAGLVADLAALVDEHPLRERPRSLLMAGLAADGRVADALRSYDDFRRLLAEELGIEPSAALTAQHAELLTGLPSALWRPPDRLPVAATSLLGRDDLLVEAAALVGQHRVVTLLGPGGVGKTRLLIELGHQLGRTRPERPVVLIELAAATPESAVEAVAAALAIDGRPGVGLGDRLASVLADVEVVLLLDNCEHVLDPVAELVERLVRTCPNVSMVTSTQERLRVAGEVLCAVPPLAAAEEDDPAIRLFVERAGAVLPGFEPGASDRARITEIVRRLDGLPLAIELAAARLHTLDVAEVAAGLDRRFRLLSSGSRTSTRHGSLRTAVAWSVGLLDDERRRTFAELSVWAGSFTTADAVAITSAGPEVADDLAQLAERSLLLRAQGRRYVLLETLRAYGAELLETDGVADDVRRRHAVHVLAQVEAADRELLAPGGQRRLERIELSLPELRAAFAWLLDHELEGAGRMLAALEDFGFFRLRPDVLAWAERLCAADADDAGPLAARLWCIAAQAAWLVGDLEEHDRRVERAATVAPSADGEDPDVAMALGNQALFDGRLPDAVAHYRRAQATSGDDRSRWIVAAATELLPLAYSGDLDADARSSIVLGEVADLDGPYAAYAWYCAGEADLRDRPQRAQERLARALELAERTGNLFVSGVAGTSSASIEARVGDPRVAAEEYRRLLSHWRRAGVWSTQWTMLRSIARLLEALGQAEEAAVLLGAVLTTTEGHRIFGDDEVALAELAVRLRVALGDDACGAAMQRGVALDGPAAVEHALRSL